MKAGPVRPHRVVHAVEEPPAAPSDGLDPAGADTVVWYVSGRGVCRPAVYHFDDHAGVWVRGSPCESVVDGGLVTQPTFGGRVEIRLVHLKFDGSDEETPWQVDYRLLER